MTDIALAVRMSKDGNGVDVESGAGDGVKRIYTLTPEQAQKFAMTMMVCAQQAQANRDR